MSGGALDLTLELGDPAHGGFCVARHEGMVYFVSGGLPGELVRVRLTHQAARFANAEVTEVLAASPDRVPHVWPQAAREGIGGADLGHVSPDAQLRWKAAVIAGTMRRIGGKDVAAEVGPVPVERVGEVDHYRTRVSFAVDGAGRLAMHRPHSTEPVSVDDMPLAVAEILRMEPFGPRWAGTWEPGETVHVVAPSASAPVLVAGTQAWYAPGGPAPATVRERVEVDGRRWDWKLAAGGFWQVNRHAPAALVATVLDLAGLGSGERVLELYSGAGLFTAPLADEVGPGGSVVSVEGAATAVADARANLRTRPQVDVLHGRVDRRAVESAGGRTDVVVLDPPRAGAGRAVMEALVRRAPDRMVLVACDPAALARDLAVVHADYRVDDVRALDLFPHTHHVEMVVLLGRRDAP